MNRPAPTILIPSILAAVLLAGCMEDRVIRTSGPLQGLPGSRSQLDPGGIADKRPSLVPRISDNETIVENPDGTRTARATSVRQLMANIARCLTEDWGQTVFIKDILSNRAKEEMSGTGMTPEHAFQELKSRRDDIMKLFNLMPMGESTPGFFLERVGPRTYRIQVSGKAADNIYFRGIDAVYEQQSYKLYWFYRDQHSAPY